jgi:hypothetical protein
VDKSLSAKIPVSQTFEKLCFYLHLQVRTFVFLFSHFLQSEAFPFLFPLLFLFLELWILANAKHWTVFATSGGAVAAPRSHVSRNLLLRRKFNSASHAVRQCTAIFPLTDESSLGIDVLAATADFQAD